MFLINIFIYLQLKNKRKNFKVSNQDNYYIIKWVLVNSTGKISDG